MEIIKKIQTNKFQILVNDIENPTFFYFGKNSRYDYKTKTIIPYKNINGEIPLFESNYIYVFHIKFKIISVQNKGYFVIEEKDNNDYLQNNGYDIYNMPKFSYLDFLPFILDVQNKKIKMDDDGYFECNLRNSNKNGNKFIMYCEEDNHENQK